MNIITSIFFGSVDRRSFEASRFKIPRAAHLASRAAARVGKCACWSFTVEDGQ